MNKKYIIIGTAAAGIGAANTLRRLDAQAEIICISDELELPYNKCHLADYASGLKEEKETYTLTAEQAKQKNITLMLGVRVVEIQPKTKQLVLSGGNTVSYDALLVATGSSPVIPQMPGSDLGGVMTFHTLNDIHKILRYIKEHAVKRAIVVGAGLSGLECADALVAHGVYVSVVEMKGQVLANQIDSYGAQLIQKKMADYGVMFYPNEHVVSVSGAQNRVQHAVLDSGARLDADILICAVGVRPNVALSEQANIELYKGGIKVDEYLQTNIPNIYAAGDVVMVPDQLTRKLVPSCTWPDAMHQGMIAAHNMAGKPKPYPGVAIVISSAFFDVKFATCGSMTALPEGCQPEGYQEVIQKGEGVYNKFYIENDQIKGFLMVGSTALLGKARRALLTGQKVDPGALFS